MATNSKRGKVKITLDKERTLYFNLNALVSLEEQGVDVSKLDQGIKMSQIRGILWAGLIHEDADLTMDQVGEMVDFDNIEEVSKAISAAFSSTGKK
ncbi:hypothetical protein GNF82_12120 [Clostridium perfringens]